MPSPESYVSVPKLIEIEVLVVLASKRNKLTSTYNILMLGLHHTCFYYEEYDDVPLPSTGHKLKIWVATAKFPYLKHFAIDTKNNC